MDTVSLLGFAVGAALLLGWRWLAPFFGWRALAAVIVGAICMGGFGMFTQDRVDINAPINEARYRVVATVEIDGVPKSASAVHAIEFVWEGDHNNRYRIANRLKGSAPLIDLGEHGMLAVALLYDPARHRTRDGGMCGRPGNFRELFDRLLTNIKVDIGLYLEHELRSRLAVLSKRGPQRDPAEPGGKMEPAFIWFPLEASALQSRQLCPDELSRAIGKQILLKSVTIELVSKRTQIDTLVTKAPPWLIELRRSQDEPSATLLSQIETGDHWQSWSIAAPGRNSQSLPHRRKFAN